MKPGDAGAIPLASAGHNLAQKQLRHIEAVSWNVGYAALSKSSDEKCITELQLGFADRMIKSQYYIVMGEI